MPDLTRERNRQSRAFLALWCLLVLDVGAVEPMSSLDVPLGDGAEAQVTVFAGQGKEVFLWLEPAYEVRLDAETVARRLGAGRWGVWLTNLYAARFLPALPSSVEHARKEDVATLIDAALAASERPVYVYLVAADKTAALALRGADGWMREHPGDKGLAGIVLFHPNLYEPARELGAKAEYLPVVGRVELPMMVLQPKSSALFWRVDELKSALERSGARVQVLPLPGVRERFFLRADTTSIEELMAEFLPELLRLALCRPACNQEVVP